MENNNKLYAIISGVVGAAVITWGAIHFGGKVSKLTKETEKIQQEAVKQDSVRVNDYKTLEVKFDSVTTDNQSKDINLTNLTTENKKLKHELYGLNVQYDSQGAKYADALYTIDSIKTVLNGNAQDKKALEGILQNSKIKINMLETELTDIRKKLVYEQTLSSAQADTVGMLQEYLNIYMVNKTPIKPKHADKVYLPGNLRLLPTDVLEIKEIKELNKEYKNK